MRQESQSRGCPVPRVAARLITPSQLSYLKHLLKQQGQPEPENLSEMTDAEASNLISGLKAKRGKPTWYGNGQFRGWEK